MARDSLPLRFNRLKRRMSRRAPEPATVSKSGVEDVNGISMESLRRAVGEEATVILEIGANDGQDSLRLAGAFPSATVHCFEPDPRALALLRRNALGDRIRVYPIAISAADGAVEFFQSSGAPIGQEAEFPDGWHLSGSIRQPLLHLDTHPWCRFDSTIKVESLRLDTWSVQEGIDSVDLIWADIQGAEADLIRGGARALSATRYLYTEFDERELYAGQLGLAGLLELLPGWEVENMYEFDVLLRNRSLT